MHEQRQRRVAPHRQLVGSGHHIVLDMRRNAVQSDAVLSARYRQEASGRLHGSRLQMLRHGGRLPAHSRVSSASHAPEHEQRGRFACARLLPARTLSGRLRRNGSGPAARQSAPIVQVTLQQALQRLAIARHTGRSVPLVPEQPVDHG